MCVRPLSRRRGRSGNTAPRMWVPSALLAVASIRCCSAFIAISPRAVSRAQRRHSVAGVEPGAHVIAAAASRSCSSNGRSRTRDQQRLSMQGSGMAEEVGTAGGDSLAETEEARWAEKQFPDCSTVVSKATRLSGLLAEVWDTLADPSLVETGRPRVLMFPECAAVAEARGLQNLYEHLEVCQDACEHFGTMVYVVPHPKGGSSGAPAPALVVQAVAGAGAGDDFAYDPDWDDDDWDIDRSLLDDDDDEDEDGMGGAPVVDAAALSVVPSSDEEVTELTKSWVQAVITDMGVCPFSVDASRAGLPVGQVRYPVTRETTAEAVYREYWREVELLVSETNERSLSTTLLITPEFSLNNAEAFEVIGQTLTQPLEALHLEDDIQLVFFHPQYAFRDGRDRIGSGDAANFARRSPFPMINILRTTQVRLGQKSIPTGLVYKQNEEVLEEVGAAHLQKMLETRDWTGLEGKKVDRRRVDYYETARKLQGMDATPPPPTPKKQESPPETDDVSGGEDSDSTVETGEVTSLADARSGARESLSSAAGSMPSSFEQGFSSSSSSPNGDNDTDDDYDGSDAAAGTPAADAYVSAIAAVGVDDTDDGDDSDGIDAAAAGTPGDDAYVNAIAAVGGGSDGATTNTAAPAEEGTASTGPQAPATGETDNGRSDVGATAPGAEEEAAAADSAGIADEDLRGVASALVKRLGTGAPLKPATFEDFSDAVDRMLDSTKG